MARDIKKIKRAKVLVSLEDFVELFFPSSKMKKGECACVVTFTGDKDYPKAHVWGAKIKHQIKSGPVPLDCHMNVSTVRRPAQGEDPGRKKTDSLTTRIIMLDDIGVSEGSVVEELPVKPTAKIETSPGNFQYLYRILPLDVSDAETQEYYEACVQGLTDEGFGDAGARCVNHTFRLPGSHNKKPKHNGWIARVTEWNPEVVYDLLDE